MTREETKQLLARIQVTYPNWNIKNVAFTVDVWFESLAKFSYTDMLAALQSYINTDRSGFAPSIGQLIGCLKDVKQKVTGKDISEMEAWSMVYKAICDSTYHAKERFDEFPPVIQKAVGSPDVLKAWGQDDNFNGNVVQALFLRNLKTETERAEKVEALPQSVKELLANTNNKMLEVGNGQEEA